MVGRNEEDVTGCFNGINIDKQEAFVANVPKRKRDTSKFQDELGSLGAAVSERLERVEHSTTELENKVFTEIGGVKENLDRFEEPFVKLKGKVMGALKELQSVDEAIAAAESLSDFVIQNQSEVYKKNERVVPRRSHTARDFLKLGSLYAFLEKAEVDVQEETGMIGFLQLLNDLKTTTTTSKAKSKGLMYVDIYFNGRATQAMVDTGATHNFVSEGEARRLGLTWTKGDG
ncbi:predicted protein [Arabidopsis lyrata subsp. lyrata]|uniref:Predicted protein n=1 Tax=Arabidopsis lyrata subsp. lyrata TaxID=81972 RepID=D7MSR3_ARALL|nr:predicted protein [Arabidopsis lyrata subsp. lyrata]